MSFKDIEIKFGNQNSDIKRAEYMQLPVGAHTIRVLQAQAKTLPTHFFVKNKVTVLCLGDECPICTNNKKIIMQFPKNFREQQDYVKINYRFFVNVFDKTPAKTCGKCQKEYKNLSATLCDCGEVLPEAAPINRVKVLAKGLTLRDDLDSIDKAILNAQGDPIGLMNYDVVLMVSGTGRDTKITPVPRTEANQPVELTQELYDLEKVTITLTPSEMLDVQRGISLKDIFAARKSAAEPVIDPIANQAEIDKANAAVASLFGN